MSWLDKLSKGLSHTREQFSQSFNVLMDRGPELDDGFWDGLEEALIVGDFGAEPAMAIVADLRETATRLALPDSHAVMEYLADAIAERFVPCEHDPFVEMPSVVLFVGINGAGKTTTVGKLSKALSDEGRKVLIGSADTFRAAAIEQLDVWGERSGVEVVRRERGADPASVCYDTIARAEELGSDIVLIDTSGRLHTSTDLMRELGKVVEVTRKRSKAPVSTVLVLDATTGQNGLQQAVEFDRALGVDGIIVTKLDGTARGGIAVAASHAIDAPVLRIGVGEGIEDLRPFDAHEYAAALIGEQG